MRNTYLCTLKSHFRFQLKMFQHVPVYKLSASFASKLRFT